MDRVRDLLRSAEVLYADETPARASGKLRYVHVACTEFLTAMHTGGRSAEDIDAGGLRDLKGLYEFDPEGQVWARSMADLLIWANKQATAARAAGQARLPEDQLDQILSWYRGAQPRGSATTRANGGRSPVTGCDWPAGSATTRT
jgi:transposase